MRVDTSAICLDITATEGGGLLGDLLCALAGGGILGTGIPLLPTADQLATLQSGLVSVLNGSLGQNLAPASHGDSVCSGQCEILELALGPLNLSLLGLNVSLDDCEAGPVQVCVSATRSEGILGSLLCALAGPQLANLSLSDITMLVTRTLNLLADGSLSGRDIGIITELLFRLVRA